MSRCRGFFGTVALLTLTSTVGAQPGGFPGGPPGGFPGGFPGGPVAFPQPGQILSGMHQDQLKLTGKQKKELEALQKEVDAKLAKLLTTDQNKQLQDMRKGPGGPGGFGAPGGGFGAPGGGFGGGPPKFGPGGGFGGGVGGFAGNPLDTAKKQLEATEEEWKVISVKLQKVITTRQALTGEARGGGFGPGGGMSRISQAQAELKTVLADPKHTKAEIDDHVTAVRKARQQSRADLEAAQKELVQMLTARQEAVLISLGYLD